MMRRISARMERFLARVPRRYRRADARPPAQAPRQVAARAELPSRGSVLGVDVGFSTIQASSSVCRLDWSEHEITWTLQRFRATPEEQDRVLRAVAGRGRLEAAAFDGPLRSDFEVIGEYRAAERLLTRRLQPKIGKPGQSSAPIGKKLNAAANDCARIVRAHCDVAVARHDKRIDDKAVVEAFPSSFMGVLLDDPEGVPNRRADRTDLFFVHLARSGVFETLLEHLLPGRVLTQPWDVVKNHDDRMALVCAFTALAVAAGDYVAVGDERQGWIILPPKALVRDWAYRDLEENAAVEREGSLFVSKP